MANSWTDYKQRRSLTLEFGRRQTDYYAMEICALDWLAVYLGSHARADCRVTALWFQTQ